MNKNFKKNRGVSLLLVLTILFSSIILPQPSVGASAVTSVVTKSKYIAADEFIKLIVQEIKLEVNISSDNPYIVAATTAGIVKEGDFTNYSDSITRTDAAVLLNRADEYLHKDAVNESLLYFVLNKRISDIKKVPEAKREDVAKVFAKGIIMGYFNGYYIQNRSFKGNDYLTTSNAKSYVKLITNTSKRAKISPDGELIRTTNLPKNAKRYEYILACYPNEFYERKFEFMFYEGYKESTRDKERNIYPVEIKKSKFKNWDNEWAFSQEMDKYLYDWTDKAETYLKYLFNVDYRTVNSKWINGLASLYVESNIDQAEMIKKYYIKSIKKNKIVIKSSIIALEPSTLYYDGANYCMRAYVKYKITAINMNIDQALILFSQYPHFENLKSGTWRTGVFDIRFGTNNGYQGDGSYWAIDLMTRFRDDYTNK